MFHTPFDAVLDESRYVCFRTPFDAVPADLIRGLFLTPFDRVPDEALDVVFHTLSDAVLTEPLGVESRTPLGAVPDGASLMTGYDALGRCSDTVVRTRFREWFGTISLTTHPVGLLPWRHGRRYRRD